MGNPTNVVLGPGAVYVAPIGTTEPVNASAALPSAWRAIGYTEEGTTFSYGVKTADVEVAEEFDPVRVAMTGREITVEFEMAEVTRQNLALAMNAGANAANDATAIEPPTPGTEVRVMIVFQADESNARWIFRQCFQMESVDSERKKAPDKATFPVKFRLEKPSGSAPFKVFPGSDGRV